MSAATNQLGDLIDGMSHGSWRWECQGEYQSDQDKLERWRRGEPFRETQASLAWQARVRALRGRGISVERVRMLTEPLTEYLEWMLSVTYRNVDAGEDIRWITEHEARSLAMPAYDFYLIDDQHLAIMRFNGAKVLTNLTDDPDVVAEHRAYRDAVWPLAIPHNDYLARAERGT